MSYHWCLFEDHCPARQHARECLFESLDRRGRIAHDWLDYLRRTDGFEDGDVVVSKLHWEKSGENWRVVDREERTRASRDEFRDLADCSRLTGAIQHPRSSARRRDEAFETLQRVYFPLRIYQRQRGHVRALADQQSELDPVSGDRGFAVGRHARALGQALSEATTTEPGELIRRVRNRTGDLFGLSTAEKNRLPPVSDTGDKSALRAAVEARLVAVARLSDAADADAILLRLTLDKASLALTASEFLAIKLNVRGYKPAEIASRMDCSDSTARVHLHNARKKLRAFLAA